MINPDLAIYLVVSGYGDDPETVTRVLGLPPTEVWVRGQPFSDTFPDARRHRSQWMLASGLPFDAAYGEHGAALLALLEPRADALRTLAQRHSIGLAVGRYFHTSDPLFFLDETLVSRFRALGLEPYFDQLPHAPTTDDADGPNSNDTPLPPDLKESA
ncbi:MAG: DUF4279 domain-containing protein [Pseudomonadota bacterium]